MMKRGLLFHTTLLLLLPVTFFTIYTSNTTVNWLNKGLSGSLQQNSTGKKVIKKKPFRNEPVEITELKVKDKKVDFDAEFESDDDWFRGLTIRLKNSSQKRIKHLEVDMYFPEMDVNGSPLSLTLSFGNIPNDSSSSSEASTREAPVSPSEVIALTLSDNNYENLKKLATRRGALISTIRINIGTVIFEDDTAWRNGFMHRRDPGNPKRWNVIREVSRAPTRKPYYKKSTLIFPILYPP